MARTANDTFTNALCEQTVGKRRKFYDTRITGLFVSVTPNGKATFAYKYWDKEAKVQKTVSIGLYEKGRMTVDTARTRVIDLQRQMGATGGKLPTNLPKRATAGEATFGDMVAAYIEYIKQPHPKKAARGGLVVDSWEQNQSTLRRPVDLWGHWKAEDVSVEVIGDLLKTMGKVEGSHAYALSTRWHLSRMFDWARGSDRKFVKVNPCLLLGTEYDGDGVICSRSEPRTRVLDPDEIRTLWHGLDECYGSKVAKLAIKLCLVTGLRPKEVVNIETAWIIDNVVHLPAWVMKNRKPAWQPLSPLARELIADALGDDTGRKYVFPGNDGKAIKRGSLSGLLCRKAHNVKHPSGAIERLGMEPFQTRDLRRTCATLASDLLKADDTRLIDDATIAQVLNHTMVYDALGKPVAGQAPSVTRKHYALSKALEPKARALNLIAQALAEIIWPKGRKMLALPKPQAKLAA